MFIDMYNSIIYLGCAVAIALMAGISIKNDYKSPVNRSFFFLAFSILCWIAFLYLMYFFEESPGLSLFFTRLTNGIGLLVLISFSEFFYQFPKKTFKIPKTAKNLMWGIISLTFLITVFTPLVQESIAIKNGEILDEVLGPLFSLYMLHYLVFLILGTIFAIKKIINTQGIEKRKVQLATSGFVLAIGGVIMTNVILPIFGIINFVEESIIFSLLIIGSAFYSIYKHRFFNPTYTSLNFARKFILISILVAMIYINHSIITIVIPSINSTVANILSFLISIYIYDRVNKYFPKFTTESFRIFQNSIIKLKSKLYYCESYAELQNLLEKQFIINLNLSNAKIYSVRKKQAYIKIPIYLKDDFTKELKKYKKDVLVLEEIKFEKKAKQSLLLPNMKKLGASICMPLFSEQRLIGFFILGSKSNKTLYSKEEISEILNIKPNLEIALMNILLKNNLQEEHNLMKEIINKKTKKLKKQIKEINDLLKQQSDFLAITAHEFRTPLSIAMFQLEDTIQSHNHPSKILDEMKTVEESLTNLKNLIQKLFDVQQYDLNQVQLNKKYVHLETFLFEIINGFNQIINKKDVDLIFDNKLGYNLFIDIDESQLRQVLYNLLDNATKFADKIILRTEEKTDDVIIKIIDNGSGIPDEDKKKIFKKFQTRDSAMGLGIGLGLYLCKKIIELHNGKIWVQDAKKQGSEFCISLKKGKIERSHESLKKEPKKSTKKTKSLRK